ncbi:MAG: acyltransferase [Schwartzia sp. (in: firmicutes)]
MLYRWMKRLKNRFFYNIRKEMQRFPQRFSVGRTSVFLDGARIDCRINHDRKRLVIGEECVLGCAFVFESDEGYIQIGNRTFINSGTHLIARSDVIIGDDVTIAWGVWVYNHDSHSLDWRERVKDLRAVYEDVQAGRDMIAGKDWTSVKAAPIRICDKAWIGMNAIILKGVTIGEGAVVGAGSVVTHDVPPWTIAAGNPAKVVGHCPVAEGM